MNAPLATTCLVTTLAAAVGCGAESDGLLSDHLVCGTAAATIADDVATVDAANSGQESTVKIGTGDSLSSQPGTTQVIGGGDETNVWGVALKLYAPAGAAGDIRVAIVDDNTSASSAPSEFASKKIPSEMIPYAAGWLLVDFGEFVTLRSNESYRLALTNLYSASSDKPVHWVKTTSGSGLAAYTASTWATPAAWTSVGGAGVHILETCQ